MCLVIVYFPWNKRRWRNMPLYDPRVGSLNYGICVLHTVANDIETFIFILTANSILFITRFVVTFRTGRYLKSVFSQIWERRCQISPRVRVGGQVQARERGRLELAGVQLEGVSALEVMVTRLLGTIWIQPD